MTPRYKRRSRKPAIVLDVELYGRPLGQLEASSVGTLEFVYLPEALSDTSLPALSLSLPKREEPYGDDEARPWFEGLLPEGEFRNLVARTLGADPNDVSGLLGAIGGECAGAVTLWRKDQARPEPSYREINQADLQSLLRLRTGSERAQHVAKARLSLAGALEKIALHTDGESWYRGIGGAPTTVILKWPSERYPDLAINEAYSLRLLEAAGVRTVASSLGEAGTDVLLVQRYDRVTRADGTISVLHQEDLCQALGIPPSQKYQRGMQGPSIEVIADLLKTNARIPERELLALATWVVGCFLLHNADGHGKNLSLLYAETGLELAPAYDVNSTRPYPDLDQRFGLRLGSKSSWPRATTQDWQRLADTLELPFEVLKAVAGEVRERLTEALPSVREQLTDEIGAEPAILDGVDEAIEHMGAILDLRLKTSPPQRARS